SGCGKDCASWSSPVLMWAGTKDCQSYVCSTWSRLAWRSLRSAGGSTRGDSPHLRAAHRFLWHPERSPVPPKPAGLHNFCERFGCCANREEPVHGESRFLGAATGEGMPCPGPAEDRKLD